MKEIVDDLVAICRAFGIFERAAVCCGTVSVPQCIALEALLEGDREVSVLAEQLGVSASAMTRLADGLERRGWVKRARDDGDRRRVTLVLTPPGRREATRLRSATERTVAAVLERVPRGKHAQVREALGLVRGALDRSRVEACCDPDTGFSD